jgi:hypothetical protein
MNTHDRLRRLARYEAVFDEPGFSFGEWYVGRTRADGVIELGGFAPSPAAEVFIQELYETGWVYDFDWGRWSQTEKARRLRTDPVAIATATAEDLAKLLTMIVRGDRFSEGELASAFEAGILTAITRRAAALASETERA